MPHLMSPVQQYRHVQLDDPQIRQGQSAGAPVAEAAPAPARREHLRDVPSQPTSDRVTPSMSIVPSSAQSVQLPSTPAMVHRVTGAQSPRMPPAGAAAPMALNRFPGAWSAGARAGAQVTAPMAQMRASPGAAGLVRQVGTEPSQFTGAFASSPTEADELSRSKPSAAYRAPSIARAPPSSQDTPGQSLIYRPVMPHASPAIVHRSLDKSRFEAPASPPPRYRQTPATGPAMRPRTVSPPPEEVRLGGEGAATAEAIGQHLRQQPRAFPGHRGVSQAPDRRGMPDSSRTQASLQDRRGHSDPWNPSASNQALQRGGALPSTGGRSQPPASPQVKHRQSRTSDPAVTSGASNFRQPTGGMTAAGVLVSPYTANVMNAFRSPLDQSAMSEDSSAQPSARNTRMSGISEEAEQDTVGRARRALPPQAPSLRQPLNRPAQSSGLVRPQTQAGVASVASGATVYSQGQPRMVAGMGGVQRMPLQFAPTYQRTPGTGGYRV